MRNFCAVLVAAGLLTAPMASAQPSTAGSLVPGKPAGVHTAQDFESHTALIVAGVVVVGVGIGLAVSGNGNQAVVNNTTGTP